MMQDEIIIHVRDDRQVQAEIREQGIVDTKSIDLDTLLDCLEKGRTDQRRYSTGLLPAGTVYLSFSIRDNHKYLVMECPETHIDYIYDKTYERFPLPRLVFGFHVTGVGRIANITLGVPAKGRLTLQTPMYRWPLSNVHADKRVCLGSNPLPNIQSLSQLEHIPRYFLSLPCNDDLFKNSNNRFGMEHGELLEHLQDKGRDDYYDHILVPDGTTLKNFIGGLEI